MAIERRIDTATWDDPWFAGLDVSGKLLFLYLLTNRRTTSCGAFEITLRAIAFETGIEQSQVESLIASFGERVQWFPDDQIVFVRNFYRRQKPNASFTTNAQRSAADLPARVRDTVFAVYPELRTPCTHPVPTMSNAETHPGDTRSHGETQAGDTRSLELELDREPEPVREPGEARARRGVVSGSPWSVLVAFLEAIGADPAASMAPAWKNKMLATAKRLIEQGYAEDAVRRCAGYMLSQDWRTAPFDLLDLERYIGKWETAGQPEREAPRKSGRTDANQRTRDEHARNLAIAEAALGTGRR